ncbi:hypothetical protein SAMN06265347_1018 [Halobellus salinus]|nr:hypothetical protein SAMN06265347_1018 [Halobellus salinus]
MMCLEYRSNCVESSESDMLGVRWWAPNDITPRETVDRRVVVVLAPPTARVGYSAQQASASSASPSAGWVFGASSVS